ncbi:MAG TPA: GMC family oxidoreductase [Polyangiaceae bacterium]|nr:GMC family oxidoreductase [Polyangiaceae bacterium]
MTEVVEYDAVVVGSGFGGSINAFHLSEAGKSVLVLERGRRYPMGSFPRVVTDVDRVFWRYPKHPESRGLYDVRTFSGLGTVVASGVGGGSLVYANIHIRPDSVVFDDPRWPKGFDRSALDPFYDRVAARLEVAPVPPELALPKRDAFRAAANALGKPAFDPDQAVAWKKAHGEGRTACQLCAQCEFGCQLGAKNTLDFNYLAAAERRNARVQTGAVVTHVEPAFGKYRVHYVDADSGRSLSVVGRRVVLSAGTLGTNEILLRSRDAAGTLPKLSAMLGYGYSGNGDFLGSIQNSRADLDPSHGPDVTTVIRFFDRRPGFTMAAPTFSAGVMEVLASLGQPEPEWLRPLSGLLWPEVARALPPLFGRGVFSKPLRARAPNAGHPRHMTNLFAIGQDNAGGRIVFEKDRIDVKWNYADENRELIERMTDSMRAVADSYGGSFAPLVTWEAFRRIISVHSLGGCRIAESPERGVVSTTGEVFGYPGLYVADGSVVPTSIGFHPAMTIAAIAERIADDVVHSFGAAG